MYTRQPFVFYFFFSLFTNGRTSMSKQVAEQGPGAPYESPNEKMADAAEMLWVVLASVSGGDWTKQTAEWQKAAARWRDNYFAAVKEGGYWAFHKPSLGRRLSAWMFKPLRTTPKFWRSPAAICVCGLRYDRAATR